MYKLIQEFMCPPKERTLLSVELSWTMPDMDPTIQRPIQLQLWNSKTKVWNDTSISYTGTGFVYVESPYEGTSGYTVIAWYSEPLDVTDYVFHWKYASPNNTCVCDPYFCAIYKTVGDGVALGLKFSGYSTSPMPHNVILIDGTGSPDPLMT